MTGISGHRYCLHTISSMKRTLLHSTARTIMRTCGEERNAHVAEIAHHAARLWMDNWLPRARYLRRKRQIQRMLFQTTTRQRRHANGVDLAHLAIDPFASMICPRPIHMRPIPIPICTSLLPIRLALSTGSTQLPRTSLLPIRLALSTGPTQLPRLFFRQLLGQIRRVCTAIAICSFTIYFLRILLMCSTFQVAEGTFT